MAKFRNYWLQTPEGKRRMSRIMKKYWAQRKAQQATQRAVHVVPTRAINELEQIASVLQTVQNLTPAGKQYVRQQLEA